MYSKITVKISIFLLIISAIIAFVLPVNGQNLSVNGQEVSGSNTEVPVQEIKIDEQETQETKVKVTETIINEPTGSGYSEEELIGGSWILTDVTQKVYDGVKITKWTGKGNEITGLTEWKDILDIIHTVSSGFKWQDPPQMMQPGSYMNLEMIYTNLDYSTPAKVIAGVKMFIDRAGANYSNMEPNAIEVLKLSKDNKQHNSEVKKGFFYAPKNLFDETKQCQLVVDCFIGKDHYVTIYTYSYQQ